MAKKKASSIAKKRPLLRTLIVCDGVTRDPNTGKSSIYGIFDKYTIQEFPTNVLFSAFVQLRGGVGKQQISCKVFDSKGKDCTAVELKLGIDCRPEKVNDIAFAGVLATLHAPGMYYVRVQADGKSLANECPLVVVAAAATQRREKD